MDRLGLKAGSRGRSAVKKIFHDLSGKGREKPRADARARTKVQCLLYTAGEKSKMILDCRYNSNFIFLNTEILFWTFVTIKNSPSKAFLRYCVLKCRMGMMTYNDLDL